MKVGIFDPYLDSLGGGERYVLTVAQHLSKNHQVEIFWNNQAIKPDIKDQLSLNLDKIKFVDNIFTREKKILERLVKTSQYDLIFFLSDGSIPLSLAKRNILHFQIPFIHVNGKTLVNKIKLSRYNGIICNSFFTKKFIDRTYGVESQVLYPPVDVSAFKPREKKNLILTVGRLVESKKHEIMIKVFKKLIEQGLKDWEFVLIGGLLESDKAYFRKLKEQVLGYPIKLLPNVSFNKLQQYYGQAKIYWHANGFGEDENKNPELFEHFGIAIVEAMAAGCLPIVYNGGGQREIVNHGVDGFLWKTEEELIAYSLRAAHEENLRERITKRAIERSKNFSVRKFTKELDKILKLK